MKAPMSSPWTALGNVYVAGWTGSVDFPGIGVGSADSAFSGGQEAFVAKLDANLSRLLAATFLGGSGLRIIGDSDAGFALALDSMGNVYVAGGTTSPDFPGIGAGSADSILLEPGEGFVAKLDANLGTLLGATFLVGALLLYLLKSAVRLALDSMGNVYVAGLQTPPTFLGSEWARPIARLVDPMTPLWRSSMPSSARSWRPPSWGGVVLRALVPSPWTAWGMFMWRVVQPPPTFPASGQAQRT